jgi:cell fate regulator YaaT (PSP1 superfamily)
LSETAPKHQDSARIVGVQFHESGKVFDFIAGDLPLIRGQRVIVESDRGPALAQVAFDPEETPVTSDRRLKRVLRLANAEDRKQAAINADRAAKAIRLAVERARFYKLPLKLVTAEFPLSGNRLILYFASEERLDYRALVKDLGHEFQCRVEMKQIGPRDVSKQTGGIGPCGRELCCSSWLRDFNPVSIKMAKDQGLALNPQKVSGVCGRLLCCLSYEHEGYVANKQGMPKIGKFVDTPVGRARVTSTDILNRRVRVYLHEDQSHHQFSPEEITILKGPIQRPDEGPKRGPARGPRRDEPQAKSSPEKPKDTPAPKTEERKDDRRKESKQGAPASTDSSGEPKRKRKRRRRRRKPRSDNGSKDSGGGSKES